MFCCIYSTHTWIWSVWLLCILDEWPKCSICRLDYQIDDPNYIQDNDTIYDLSKELNALELLDEEDLIPSRVSIFLPEQKEKSAQIISDNPISGIWNRANGKLIIAERYPLGTQLQKLNQSQSSLHGDAQCNWFVLPNSSTRNGSIWLDK